MTTTETPPELEQIVKKYCGASKNNYLDGDFVLPEVIQEQATQAITQWANSKVVAELREIEREINRKGGTPMDILDRVIDHKNVRIASLTKGEPNE